MRCGRRSLFPAVGGPHRQAGKARAWRPPGALPPESPFFHAEAGSLPVRWTSRFYRLGAEQRAAQGSVCPGALVRGWSKARRAPARRSLSRARARRRTSRARAGPVAIRSCRHPLRRRARRRVATASPGPDRAAPRARSCLRWCDDARLEHPRAGSERGRPPNSRARRACQPSGWLVPAASSARCRLTANWQLAFLPKAPRRTGLCTPAECDPAFGKLVSSMIQ